MKIIKMHTNINWITLEKFCKETGLKADTIRKNIRAGGDMYKVSTKFMNKILIDVPAYLAMVYQNDKMAA
ncbi:MAG: hypothetical protein EKK57_02250 [Proteobacteria bacterium]|nr:MAG: hypothetical protein EKK57_02250 [Pseudomonadota bacterium]